MRDAGEDFSWGSRGGILAFQYLPYWYGGLYVVIEGWRTLGLQDERVDDLLDSPNVELLRRYRNGVFHFQRKYLDDRFLDLMGEGQSVVEWVRELNDAFSQYLLREVRLPADPKASRYSTPCPKTGRVFSTTPDALDASPWGTKTRSSLQGRRFSRQR